MCLITKQIQPLVAERDILVYKVLEKNNESPFYRFKYAPDKGYDIGEICSQPICDRQKANWETPGNAFIVLSTTPETIPSFVKEGIHCYRDVCHQLLDFLDSNDYKIVQFKIPKGAHYFIGGGAGDHEIASDQVITGNLKPVRLKLLPWIFRAWVVRVFHLWLF